MRLHDIAAYLRRVLWRVEHIVAAEDSPMTQPVVLRDVRLVLPTGEKIALTVERGPDEDGKRIWYVYGPESFELPPGAHVVLDVLPAQSTVRIAVAHYPDGRRVFMRDRPST